MTAADGIARTLLAWKDKDYFRLLQLKRPEADALGRPVWSGTDADVSRAFRRMSLLVHPDKFVGDIEKQAEARTAFEALNEAHRMLRDKGLMEQILAKEAEPARERRRKREAEATLEERLVMNSQHKEAKSALTEAEGKAFNVALKRQQNEKLEAMRRKKARLNKGSEGNFDSDGSDDDAIATAVAAAAEQEKAAAEARQQAQDQSEEAAAAARRRANAAKRNRRTRPPPKPQET